MSTETQADRLVRLKALKDSVEKWEQRVEDLTAGRTPEPAGSYNCPLCREYSTLYRRDDRMNCDGCPVFEKTGRTGCEGTPHENYVEVGFIQKRLQAARDEVDFLQGLYEKELDQAFDGDEGNQETPGKKPIRKNSLEKEENREPYEKLGR